MNRVSKMFVCCFCLAFALVAAGLLFAQQDKVALDTGVIKEVIPTPMETVVSEESAEKVAGQEDSPDSDLVTLDFKDADIHSVLRILALKGNVNIVTTPDVAATVTMRLANVTWERALDTLLKTYGFAYEKDGNVVSVSTPDKMKERREAASALSAVELPITKVFVLKYVDANDIKEMLKGQLSENGKIDILQIRKQRGWKAGAAVSSPKAGVKLGEISSAEAGDESDKNKSRVLVVTDKVSIIEKVEKIINEVDIMPKQILIETRIMEVNRNKLKDIGFNYGTGSGGATSSTITSIPYHERAGTSLSTVGGHILGAGGSIVPSTFSPQATGMTYATTGLELIYKKLSGSQFEVMLHALEEDVQTNTLSAPHIVTLDSQEAYIMIGEQKPILASELSAGDNTTQASVNQTLDYYQDIGIQLNVLPKICGEKQINLLVQPTVTSSTSNVSATSTVGGSSATSNTLYYPIIKIRQAKTQVLLNDGETVVIGGLLKDVKSREIEGVPFLSKIPFVGVFFRRETTDIEKIDLLIFITVRIIKENDFSPTVIENLEKRVEGDYDTVKAANRKKKKKK